MDGRVYEQIGPRATRHALTTLCRRASLAHAAAPCVANLARFGAFVASLCSPRGLSRAVALEETKRDDLDCPHSSLGSVGMALALAAPAAFAQDTTTDRGRRRHRGRHAPSPEGHTKTVEPTGGAGEEGRGRRRSRTTRRWSVTSASDTSASRRFRSRQATESRRRSARPSSAFATGSPRRSASTSVSASVSPPARPRRSAAVRRQTRDAPSVLGAAVHGGVPLVFAHQKHYKFLLVPELNVGFAQRDLHAERRARAPPRSPTRRTAASTSTSARASAPRSTSDSSASRSLALQATVGAFIRRDADQDVVGAERRHRVLVDGRDLLRDERSERSVGALREQHLGHLLPPVNEPVSLELGLAAMIKVRSS